MTNETTTCRFVINTWQHLYSLQQAVRLHENLSANRLVIEGVIRNDTLFDRRDMPIQLVFLQVVTPPYKRTADNLFVFGELHRNASLTANIPLEERVFAELKKNLVEYLGIEGIHIVVTIGLRLPEDGWQETSAAAIVQLDYAMKGDGG